MDKASWECRSAKDSEQQIDADRDYFVLDLGPPIRDDEDNTQDYRLHVANNFRISYVDFFFQYLNPEYQEEEYKHGDRFQPYLDGKMADITESQDGGVLKLITKKSEGRMVPENAFVTIYFTAYFEDNWKSFDSTHLRYRPYRFPLKNNAVVKGLEIAVSSMREGEVSRFLLKREYSFQTAFPYAYKILFVIQLVKFEEPSDADDFYILSLQDRSSLPSTVLLKVAKKERVDGDEFMEKGDYRKALHCYKRAQFHVEIQLNGGAADRNVLRLGHTYALEAVAAAIELKYFDSSLAVVNRALEYNASDIKALIFKGIILYKTGKFSRALSSFQSANRVKPGDPEIKRYLNKIKEELKKVNPEDTSKKNQMPRDEKMRSTMVLPEVEHNLEIEHDFECLQLEDTKRKNGGNLKSTPDLLGPHPDPLEYIHLDL